MRKRILPTAQQATTPADDWLDLESMAEVEITSEDPEHPIESALLPDRGTGWRAAAPGAQTIRIILDPPQALHTIRLEFRETAAERTQEYVLRCSTVGSPELREIVRQQWNFSPGGATDQVEDHGVDIAGVTALELEIIPDIGGGSAVASLAKLRLV